MSFLSKEIGTAPSYLTLRPTLDGDHLNKCNSPGKKDHKTSLFFAHGLYELSPGIFLCDYVHRRRMGDLFALGDPTSEHYLSSLPEERGPVRPDYMCACKKQLDSIFAFMCTSYSCY